MATVATTRAETGEEGSAGKLSIPFLFYNESFGFAGGYVYGLARCPEPPSQVLGTVMVGTRGSGMLALAGQDLCIPWLDRLFIDSFASFGYVGEIESHVNGNSDFPASYANVERLQFAPTLRSPKRARRGK